MRQAISMQDLEADHRVQAGPTKAVVKLRHPWRTVSATVVALMLGGVLYSLLTNPNLGLEVIFEYLLSEPVIEGVKVTIMLTLVGMSFAVILATILAVMTLSDNWVLNGVAKLYIWIFRGTPLLVQLIFWAYMGVLYPHFFIGIPFTDIVFVDARTSDVIGPTLAALLGLITHEASYSAEIVRSGIIGVSHGQKEAGASLGMSPGRTLRRIILPQAMRTIVPPLGNEFIAMLKYTSIIAVIGGNDLMTNVQHIYTQNFQVIPLLIVASVWYLVLVSFFSFFQTRIERYFGRGVAGQKEAGFIDQMFQRAFGGKKTNAQR